MSVKVKICGLTNAADARYALACGADYLGFVLHPASPRYIAPEALRELLPRLPGTAVTVGVTVNRSAAENRELMKFCGFNILQLHGGEPPHILEELADLRVWKALHIRSADDLRLIDEYRRAEVIVADASRGGSGERCDWRLAGRAAAMHMVALAGGITPDNVAEALAIAHPAVIDCSGGVEASPGIKDYRKLIALLEKVKHHE